MSKLYVTSAFSFLSASVAVTFPTWVIDNDDDEEGDGDDGGDGHLPHPGCLIMIVNLWDLLHFIRQLHTWVPFAADSYTSNEKLLSVNSGILSLASITYKHMCQLIHIH